MSTLNPERFERLGQIFREVVEFESAWPRDLSSEARRDAREKILARRCAGDADLRAEVERLLGRVEASKGGPGRDESAGDPLLALGQRVRATVREVVARSEPAEGRFGRYALLRVIGVGGMGTVYEAEQESPRRRVALKILPRGFAAGSNLRRFELEAEVLARLQHPGIAQIFEAGIHDGNRGDGLCGVKAGAGAVSSPSDAPGGAHPQEISASGAPVRADAGRGQPYFAMELVHGVPLDEYVRRVSRRKLLHTFIEVCGAVHHAHAKGVVHRDLKPANILVDVRGRPKVLDFGVARLVDVERRQATLRTRQGQIVGTVRYMSPEQAGGDSNDVDTRSDVYSLGVILCELLVGRSPHDLSGRLLHEAVQIIREREPRRLGELDRSLRGSDLEVVVAHALERDKERRYQSARELASDVLRVLREQPIEARPPTPLYQLTKFARRNRSLMLGVATTSIGLTVGLLGLVSGILAAGRAGSGLVVGLVLGVGGLGLGAVAARRALGDLFRQRELAERARASARLEGEKAEAMQVFLSSFFGSALPGRARGRTLSVREALDIAASSIERSAESSEVHAWAGDLIGTSYEALGELDRAEFHLRSALRTRRRLYGLDGAETLQTTEHLARVLDELGRAREAESLARDCLVRWRDTRGSDDSRTIASTSTLARALCSSGRPSEAGGLLEESLARASSVLGERHEVTLATRNNLGVVLRERGDLVGAERQLRAACEGRRALLGDEHPHTLRSVTNLAVVLQLQRHFREASELLQSTLEFQERILGRDHPDTLDTLFHLATVYRRSDRTYLAVFLLERLVTVCQETLGRESPKTLRAWVALACALLEQGKLEAAISMFQRALRLALHLAPAGSPVAIAIYSNLGFAHHRLGEAREAADWFVKAVEVARAILPPEDVRITMIEANYATSLLGLGRTREAQETLESCHAVLQHLPDGERQLPRVFLRPVDDLTELYEAWGRQSTVSPFDLDDEQSIDVQFD